MDDAPRGLDKLSGARCQENGGLADQWYMDDGDIMCHPVLVLPFLQDFDVASARVGAERNPLKTDVINFVSDVDEAAHRRRAEHGQNVSSDRR